MVERGDILMSLGNPSEAHGDYKRALELNPGYAHAIIMDATAYLREGDRAKAGTVFTKGIELARKEAEPALEELHKKAKEHLDEDKQETLKEFTDALTEGDQKKLRKMQPVLGKEFKGVDRAWVNKAQSICTEISNAAYWLKELEKEKTFPGWKKEERIVSETEHYTVSTTINKSVTEFIAGQLESAYKLYRMRFALQKKQKVTNRVFMFKDMKDYYKGGGPPGSGGYANPYLKKLVWPINPKDYKSNGYSLSSEPDANNLKDTLLVLFHEAFHIYVNKFLETPPQVFNEGCADYFGPSKFNIRKVGRKWSGDLIVRINGWRLGYIKGMIKEDLHLPLEPFWKLTKGEMYGPYAGHHYAQAWAWVFFLFERTSGSMTWKQMPESKKPSRKYFKLLGDYYKGLRKGKGLNRAWGSSFGRMKGAKLAAFEKEWREFINRLK
jgi:tetratricopeptide (TPR) repeat protein